MKPNDGEHGNLIVVMVSDWNNGSNPVTFAALAGSQIFNLFKELYALQDSRFSVAERSEELVVDEGNFKEG